jgi:FMN phosphatase YigB (HAD superfamily)
MVRAVLFDLWGTLIIDDPDSSERRRLQRIDDARRALADLGFDYDPVDIDAALLAAGTELERIHRSERDISARGRTVLCLRHIDLALPDRIPDDAWPALDAALLTQARAHPPLVIEGAREVLETVRTAGLRTGLVSNAGITPGFVLRDVLAGFGLLPLLERTVFSDEVELSKPAEAIFAHALDELGVGPGEAVFVGDHPHLDVFGARRAGLWVAQVGDMPPDGAGPHARIPSVAALPEVLRELAPTAG